MFKRILAAGILLASALAFGQGACYPAGVVLLDTGRPANGASVRVCTAGSTGSPCTPGASLFTDPTLGTPLGGSPVVTTDAHGNFGFCAAAGSNYDLQISGTGITTLNIKNLPLPPTTPIVAASLTSSSANPATVGQIKLASGDCLDWRNNANSGNIQLCKTGAAAGNVPADTFDMTASFTRSQAFIDNSANPASAGAVRCGNSVGCVEARNAANGADLILLQADSSNNAQITPPIRQVGQAAPSGIASSGLMWFDSGTNRWRANNNNVGSKTLANTDGDTLTNTSLTTPSISDPTISGVTHVKRVVPDQASSIVTGDIGTLTGWGNTASVSSAAGSDTAGVIAISSSGTGQAPNPTFVLTFHDGAWVKSPICVIGRNDGNTPQITAWLSGATTTAVTMGILGTPVAGSTYSLVYICVGRP